MFVAKRMTNNPVTISPTTTLSQATEIMENKHIRRLPVMEKGKLVGIVTDRDLREVAPSPATTLSVHELKYLLAKMQVQEIMKKSVITIPLAATIEEAALVMYTEKIGGLVVVDEQEHVMGIITETDVFKCFVDVMGLLEGRTRVTLEFPDKVGALCEITGIFAEMGISIFSIATQHLDNGKIETVLRAEIADTNQLTQRLAAKGYPVTHLVHIGAK